MDRHIKSDQAIAEAVGEGMYALDRASRGLGMKLVSIGPGRAVMTMAVRADMLNGHGICHGGFIFTLADSTFAFACNARNKVAVAQAGAITFCAPAKEGDMLTATAEERTLSGRTGIYDIAVTRADGATIALLRGTSRQIKGEVVPGLTP